MKNQVHSGTRIGIFTRYCLAQVHLGTSSRILTHPPDPPTTRRIAVDPQTGNTKPGPIRSGLIPFSKPVRAAAAHVSIMPACQEEQGGCQRMRRGGKASPLGLGEFELGWYGEAVLCVGLQRARIPRQPGNTATQAPATPRPGDSTDHASKCRPARSRSQVAHPASHPNR